MPTDNIKNATVALQAELSLAKEGQAHYSKLVDSLSAALASLTSVAPETGPRNSGVAPSKRGRKARSPTRAGKLPFTGGDFWRNLVKPEPLSAPEILDAAVAKIGASVTPDLRKKLSSRMVFALNAMVASKSIRDSGKGRDRRYFIK